MEVEGLCDLCGKPGGGFSCILCGKRVCRDCVSIRGACRKCTDGFQSEYDKRVVGRILSEKGLSDVLKP